MKNFTFNSRKATPLYAALIALSLTISAHAMDVNGPTVACPGSTRQYTVSGTADITKVSIWQGRFPQGPATLLREMYVSQDVPFNVAFPANYTGIVSIIVNSWYLFEGNTYFNKSSAAFVNVRVPAPAVPNGGLVTVCSSGEQVILSALPGLTNTQDDCYFHCGVKWEGPRGWSLVNDYASGNPLDSYTTFDNTKLVAPSGISNGNAGQVTVTAYYSQCGFPQNTSSSATVWYGTPLYTNPTVNGSPAQSFNSVSNGQASLAIQSASNAATSWSWVIDGGSGYIYPNGNSCNVSTSGFMRVVARSSNRCGQGDSYTFYIQNSSTSGLRIAPNPASSNLAIQFDYPEMTEAVSAIILYDDKGKIVKSFDGEKAKKEKYFKSNKAVDWDVRDLQKGTYFLHVNYGSFTGKSQVSIH